MEDSKAQRNRIYYLDVLRVIACLSVVMIHVSAKYVIEDIGSFNFWIGNILDGISRVGVPIFVMISGSLMLDKDYQYSKKNLIHHIIKLIIFFIFWSGIYCCMYEILAPIILEHKYVKFDEVIRAFIEGHFHLWFIYMIIGLYLILPLLRLWVKKENKKYVEYFIILSIIFSFLIPQIVNIGSNYCSIFNDINNIIEKIDFRYIGGYTTYFLLGWYLHNYDLNKNKIIYILGGISIATTIIGTYILSISTGKEILMYGNFTLNILLQSIMVFIFIKNKYVNRNIEENKYINLVSNYSLGIYAIHVAITFIIYEILYKINFDIAILNIPTVFIISIAISIIIISILKKIPILKKIV